MKPEEAASVRDIAIMQNLRPYLDREVGDLIKIVDMRAYTALSSSEGLDPQLALNLWTERFAYMKVLKKFNHKLKGSQAVAAQVAQVLDKSD